MKVDIWSDVVCPWCYIGKRRFEAALSRFAYRDEIEVTWKSFELDPSAAPSPEEPRDYSEHLARKYGITSDRAQEMIDRVISAAAEEGLNFRFDIARRGNTFDAHRVLHLALDKGLQNQLKENLDHGTFTEGLPVSDHQALTEVAVATGLDEIEVKEALTSGAYADRVRQDEVQARAHGITAVPFFVIDGKYGVAGAHPADTLLEVLERAWQERSPLTLVGEGVDAAACADGSCEI